MNEMETISLREEKFRRVITVVSILVPILVALLFGVRIPGVEPLSFLPPIYATINGITALFLLWALWAIKNGRQRLHRNLMTCCIAFSALFLLMYVAYHMTSDPTAFGGTGIWKYFYYFILVSHILLSVVVIPLVLNTFARAYLGKFESHRKLARITFPIWLYVAVTGVVVYLMISPYYSH
jgi:putative membrane protein